MELQTRKVSDLIPYINNSRTHSEEQINQIIGSIKEFGFTNPILLEEENGIIAGHGRLMAVQKMGWSEVPCVTIKGLTKTQIKALNIADNQIALNAGWDLDKLKLEIKGLDENDFNLDTLGFTKNQIDDFLFEEVVGLTDEDETPEIPEVPKTKLNDLWILGKHKILCGDSTSIEDLNKLMEGKQANIVYTDPPYNINYGNIKHDKFKQRDIKNDSMDSAQYREFCNKFCSNIKTICDGIVYCWGAQGKDGRILFTVLDEYFHNSTTIIWYKDQFTLGRGKYHNQYEPCWFGWNKSGESFIDNRKLVNVWKHQRPKKSDLHPTMKPVELIEIALTHSSKIEDVVLDIFLGSGSTLIACEKLNRICYGIELDPKYIDVIIQRWQNFTGKEAIHEETGKRYNEL